MSIDTKNLYSGRRKGIGGGPKRTLKELADEFDIPVLKLASWLRAYDGPECSVRLRNAVNAAAWYDPKAMRAWWKALPEEIRKGVKP